MEADAAPRGLFSDWERRERLSALGFAALLFAGCLSIAWVSTWPRVPWGPALALCAAAAGLLYAGLTRKIRRRRVLLARPFPPEWAAILQREVLFYRALPPEGQERFRRLVQVFLGEKRVTGIKTPVDDTVRVLAAASAVIPIFGFSDWEWHQIDEVLIYPGRFDHGFAAASEKDAAILGLVGDGFLNRLMVLSKPDLLAGFRDPGDKRNVGVHEFAHLVDKADGVIDGVPRAGLDRRTVGPWLELVRGKMAEIEAGESDLNPYAATSESEFFAVASEYFFERPGVMREKHPRLFAALKDVFDQDLGARIRRMRLELRRPRPSFGRNSPCPCGSGVKFKKCCRLSSDERK